LSLDSFAIILNSTVEFEFLSKIFKNYDE